MSHFLFLEHQNRGIILPQGFSFLGTNPRAPREPVVRCAKS